MTNKNKNKNSNINKNSIHININTGKSGKKSKKSKKSKGSRYSAIYPAVQGGSIAYTPIPPPPVAGAVNKQEYVLTSISQPPQPPDARGLPIARAPFTALHVPASARIPPNIVPLRADTIAPRAGDSVPDNMVHPIQKQRQSPSRVEPIALSPTVHPPHVPSPYIDIPLHQQPPNIPQNKPTLPTRVSIRNQQPIPNGIATHEPHQVITSIERDRKVLASMDRMEAIREKHFWKEARRETEQIKKDYAHILHPNEEDQIPIGMLDQSTTTSAPSISTILREDSLNDSPQPQPRRYAVVTDSPRARTNLTTDELFENSEKMLAESPVPFTGTVFYNPVSGRLIRSRPHANRLSRQNIPLVEITPEEVELYGSNKKEFKKKMDGKKG